MRKLLDSLLADHPRLAQAAHLAQELGRLIQTRDVIGFDAWLCDVEKCDCLELQRFAAALREDEAVRMALSSPWSNGQTEGQINRLKFLKRSMYGRASFDLLQKRVLFRA